VLPSAIAIAIVFGSVLWALSLKPLVEVAGEGPDVLLDPTGRKMGVVMLGVAAAALFLIVFRFNHRSG
jgi:hypothetical protein